MNLLLMGTRTFTTTMLAIVGASAVVAGGIAGFAASRFTDSEEVTKARKDKAEADKKAKEEAKAKAKAEVDGKADVKADGKEEAKAKANK